MSDSNHIETEDLSPRTKKAQREKHQILPAELALEPESVVEPTWDDIKHSVEFLRQAAKELDGLELRDSDVYALMYTPDHHKYFVRYSERK